MASGPKGWRTLAQKEFIELWMSEFLVKKASKRLDEFWDKMIEAFFAEFPEEVILGLPVQNIDLDPNADPPRQLTKEEKDALSEAITARTKQLHNSFNNGYTALVKKRGGVSHSTSSLAATLFKARPKRKRRHQVLEVYQKEYKATVQQALSALEFETMNEAAQCRDDDGDWIDDNDDEIKVKRISEARRQRMKVHRRVVQELWDNEDESVKERIRERAKQEVVVAEATEMEEVDGKIPERTPEEYQLSLDESLQVAEMFLTEFQKMTAGWGCWYMLDRCHDGRRVGNEEDELSSYDTHSCCFGSTRGRQFRAMADNWKKGVAGTSRKIRPPGYISQTRLSRALYSAEEEEDDSDATSQRSQKEKEVQIEGFRYDSRESTPAAKSKPARRPRKIKAQKSKEPLPEAQQVPTDEPTAPTRVPGLGQHAALGRLGQRGAVTRLWQRGAVGRLGNAALSHDFGSAASGYPLAGANVTPYFFPVGFGMALGMTARLGASHPTWDSRARNAGLGFEHAGPAERKNPATRPVARPLFKQPGVASHNGTPAFAFGDNALPALSTTDTSPATPAIATPGSSLHAPQTPTSKHAASAPKRSSPLAHPPMQPVAEPSPTSAAPIVRARSDTPPPLSTPTYLGHRISSAGGRGATKPSCVPQISADGECPEATGLEANAWGNGEENGAGETIEESGEEEGCGKQKEGEVNALGASNPLQNAANAATSSNPTASAPSTPSTTTPTTPALVFTTTNNNRQRALEQARRDREKVAAATAPKPGDVQLANPASNDYNLVVVVPAERPRRQIIPPKNRGAIVSMVDKRQAVEDAQLLEALKGSNAGDKRKAEEKAGPATAKRQALLRSFGGFSLTFSPHRAKKGKA
ncbi:hypothetical protein B0H13DRAFT_1880542 [Mycena leptocephala]|nr:hypothetical protein B0H13DRAFT_1880542 [Mycena leptocephala]